MNGNAEAAVEERPGSPAGGADERFTLESIYDEYGGRIYGYILSFTGRPEDAEDVLQNVFLRVMRARSREVTNMEGFLYVVARNESLRFISRRKATAPVTDVVIFDDDYGLEEERAAVSRSLLGLPVDQREVVILKIYHGKTFKEISAIAGISQNTAASRYRLAIDKLRVALGRWMGAE